MHTSENSHKNMNDLGGRWSGTIKTGDKVSQIQVNFTSLRVNDASICLPGHDGKFISLTNAEYEPPKVHFEYVSTNNRGIFDGTLSSNRMTGSFNQNGESGNFELTKTSDEGEDGNKHYYSDLNYPQ